LDASTTTKSGYLQPAVIGGVVTGVLSALPFVSGFNACCCLWVVSGSLVATYLLQQNRSTPLTPGDGALVGLLSGVIGVVIATVLSIPIDLVFGPIQREMMQQFVDSANSMSPEVRQFLQRFGDRGEMGVGGMVLFRVIGFIFFLMIGSVFSTLGGLLGAVIFSRGVRSMPSDNTLPS